MLNKSVLGERDSQLAAESFEWSSVCWVGDWSWNISVVDWIPPVAVVIVRAQHIGCFFAWKEEDCYRWNNHSGVGKKE